MKNHFRALIDLPAIILCGWLLTLPVAVRAAEATHPLDALNEAEISSAVKLLQAAPNFPPTALFSTVVLHEPPKAEVLAFKKGAKFRREAFAIVLDREKTELTKPWLICAPTKFFGGKRSRACSRWCSPKNLKSCRTS